MGCDIHLFVEKKKDNKWECIYDEGELYNTRSYMLFSILADVRNDGTIIPISKPKGIPNDASNTVKGYMDDWGGDIHSKSFLSVQELLEYDWTQCVEESVYMSKEKYISYKNWLQWQPKHIPDGLEYYSREEFIDEKDYKETYDQTLTSQEIKAAELRDVKTKIKVNLRFMYSQYLKQFYTEVLPVLLSECNGDFESVRLVFGFDN